MTHIHPDSIRLLLRCGWEAMLGDRGSLWWGKDERTCTTTEALALCRDAQPTPSVEEGK